MIKDFSNPHKSITPVKTTSIKCRAKKYKVVRKNGLHQVFIMKEDKSNPNLKRNSIWQPCYYLDINGNDRIAIFQTIQEAENMIQKLASDTITYYYKL
jgi:hypothetical protein